MEQVIFIPIFIELLEIESHYKFHIVARNKDGKTMALGNLIYMTDYSNLLKSFGGINGDLVFIDNKRFLKFIRD